MDIINNKDPRKTLGLLLAKLRQEKKLRDDAANVNVIKEQEEKLK